MCWARLNFYPRPPRGGRHSQHRGLCLHRGISIHALREEGDTARNRRRNLPRRFLSTPSARRATRAPRAAQRLRPISIHALREEGDQDMLSYLGSKRGISIHALREEGDVAADEGHLHHDISIHALREEGDRTPWRRLARYAQFLSTPSARRATYVSVT